MAEKIDLDKYVDTKEMVNDAKSMTRYGMIIDAINKEMGFDVRQKEAKDDYQNFDFILQVYVAKYNEYPDLLAMFNEHARKNGFDPKEYLRYALKKITENRSNVEAYITGLLDSGIIEDVYVDDDGVWTIKSEIVNFSFQAADVYYKNQPEILSYIQNEEGRKRGCHKNAEFLLIALSLYGEGGEAVTAKLKNAVGIEFYHSYYRQNGRIIDLNNNVVMTEEDYNRLYQPEIISVVTFEEYKEKCEEVKTKATSTLMPLLEIAAYEEYKGIAR